MGEGWRWWGVGWEKGGDGGEVGEGRVMEEEVMEDSLYPQSLMSYNIMEDG